MRLAAMSEKRSILAVDDDASVCEFYEHEPEAGSAIEVSMRDERAPRHEWILRTACADLILMDIMMPDQDGISFTRELRARRKTSEIPIIVVAVWPTRALNDALLSAPSISWSSRSKSTR